MSELRERLRAAFAHPENWVKDAPGLPAAKAEAMLREHVVQRIDGALQSEGVRALVVKGEGLARTVYDAPWMRPMGDVDLVVSDHDAEGAIEALVSAGFEREPAPPGRTRSMLALNETELRLPVGTGAFSVEIHTSLDKVVRRPVPLRDVMTRAVPLGEMLCVPAVDDHLLLVVLHAAASDFDHPVGWLDMHQLLGAGIDTANVVERARRWKLQTAMFTAMRALRAAGSERVPDGLIEACRPGRVRAACLQTAFALGEFPPRGAGGLGIRWAVRQTPLRDDTWRWLVGCGRYGVSRLIERSTSAAIAVRTASNVSKPRG